MLAGEVAASATVLGILQKPFIYPQVTPDICSNGYINWIKRLISYKYFDFGNFINATVLQQVVANLNVLWSNTFCGVIFVS